MALIHCRNSCLSKEDGKQLSLDIQNYPLKTVFCISSLSDIKIGLMISFSSSVIMKPKQEETHKGANTFMPVDIKKSIRLKRKL